MKITPYALPAALFVLSYGKSTAMPEIVQDNVSKAETEEVTQTTNDELETNDLPENTNYIELMRAANGTY